MHQIAHRLLWLIGGALGSCVSTRCSQPDLLGVTKMGLRFSDGVYPMAPNPWSTATKRPFSKIGQKVPYGSGSGLLGLGEQTVGGLLED